MARINQRLAEDESLVGSLTRSIERYVAERESIEPLGSSVYPGGGPHKVKCLHAHVAHELITGDNPIGRIALDVLGWSDPSEPCA